MMSCLICEGEMVRFENKVVMFDEIPVICSGWLCPSCGKIQLDEKETERVLTILREARQYDYK